MDEQPQNLIQSPNPSNPWYKKRWLLGSLIILAVLILGALLMWLSYYKTNKSYLVQPTLTDTIPIPKSTDSQTKSWKTYTNTQYGLEFKYPSEWHDAGRDIAIQDFFTTASGYLDKFNIQLLSSTESLQAYAQNEVSANNCPPKDSQPGDHIIEQTPQGVLYVLYCSASSETYVYIFKNQAGNLIQLMYHDDFNPTDSESQKTSKFKSIIATIKLTDQTSVDTSNWKTYVSQTYGFQIIIPADWEAKEEGPGTINFYSAKSRQAIEQNYANCDGRGSGSCIPELGAIDLQFSNITGIPNAIPGTLKTKTIGNLVFSTYDADGLFGEPHYEIRQGNKVYNFGTLTKANTEQVLQTLKFTK